MAKKRSKTAIATEREALLEIYYQERGRITTKVTKKSTWSKGKDFFGIGDILSYKGGVTKITDVSSYNSYGKIEIMKDWLLDNLKDLPDKIECEVAVWKKKSKRKAERFLITTIIIEDGVIKVKPQYEVEVKAEWYKIIKEQERRGNQ